MKYLIEITEFAECPSDWTNPRSWPHEGVFTVKPEPDYAYIVGRNSVKLIYDGNLLTSTPYSAPPETVVSELVCSDGYVSESLFLRAIAAASRGEVVE